MQRVKALKALPGRQEGTVFSLDENSAAYHREAGDVEFVDDTEAPEAGGLFVQTGVGHGNMAVTQVAPADYPVLPTDPPATGTGAAAVDERPATADAGTSAPAEVNVTKASNKADLVAYAARFGFPGEGGARESVTEAQAEELSKADLVARLGL